MGCNRDEAARAKQAAEKKMEENDFEGARTIVVNVQKLHPKLKNIKQMLSICEVLCSARKTSGTLIGSDKDWYGILQIQGLADESTVKKQYKRLALLLHPDKNRFPGAESAFKLICEANEVLSDPKKKYLYDNKIRVASSKTRVDDSKIRVPPGYYERYIYKFRGMAACQKNFYYDHEKREPEPKRSFWTRCPFCGKIYEGALRYLNTSFHCVRCSKEFITCEATGIDGFEYEDEEDYVPNESEFDTGVKRDMGSSDDTKPGGPDDGDKVNGDFRGNSNVDPSRGLKEGLTCNGNAKIGEMKDESRKRRESSSESDFHFPGRKRQNISNNDENRSL